MGQEKEWEREREREREREEREREREEKGRRNSEGIILRIHGEISKQKDRYTKKIHRIIGKIDR